MSLISTPSPTLSGTAIIDPTTNVIACICIIAFILVLPVAMYSFIMARWCCDKTVQEELAGQHGTKQSGEESTTLTVLPPVLISFRRVCFSVPDRQNPTERKQLLKDVSGWLSPGSLTAILGPSGCGKTTLLTLLADQDENGEKSGDVFVNGEPRAGTFRRLCAYVQQNDVLMDSLTTRESLWFACELRLGAQMGRSEKITIVHQTLVDLDLAAQADVPVFRLSGGQKRRLTVALELVARPSVVLLDEPTSGLDAGGALKLVQVLRGLANGNRTIAVTIHQPRSDAFQLFDRCILMNVGRVVYNGPVSGILTHFAPEHHVNELDEPVNPADLVLDLTHSTPGEASPMDEQKLLAMYLSSKMYTDTETALDGMHATTAGARFLGLEKVPPPVRIVGGDTSHVTGDKYASTLLKQAFTLTRRAFVNDIRNPAYVMQWVLGIVMFLFLGMLYCYVDSPGISGDVESIDLILNGWGACTLPISVLGVTLNMTTEQANETLLTCGREADLYLALYLARVSLLYQLLASMFFSEMPQVAAVHQDRAMFMREHGSRSYSSAAWVLSWVCKLAFAGFVKGMVYTPFVYFSAQLPYLAEPYFLFCIFMGTMSMAGSSMALLVSSATQSFETAIAAFVLVNVVAQNLCGYFLTEELIGWWFRWIYCALSFCSCRVCVCVCVWT